MTDQQVGERLRVARTIRKKTQAETAQLLGIEQSGVSDIEHGRRALKIVDAWKLIREWQIPPEVFFDPDMPLLRTVSGPFLKPHPSGHDFGGPAAIIRAQSSRAETPGPRLRLVVNR